MHRYYKIINDTLDLTTLILQATIKVNKNNLCIQKNPTINLHY